MYYNFDLIKKNQVETSISFLVTHFFLLYLCPWNVLISPLAHSGLS